MVQVRVGNAFLIWQFLLRYTLFLIICNYPLLVTSLLFVLQTTHGEETILFLVGKLPVRRFLDNIQQVLLNQILSTWVEGASFHQHHGMGFGMVLRNGLVSPSKKTWIAFFQMARISDAIYLQTVIFTPQEITP